MEQEIKFRQHLVIIATSADDLLPRFFGNAETPSFRVTPAYFFPQTVLALGFWRV